MADNFAFVHAVFHIVLFFAIHGQRARRGRKRRKPSGIRLRVNPQPVPVIKQAVETATQLHKRKEVP